MSDTHTHIKALLSEWLDARLSNDAQTWFASKKERIAEGNKRLFYTTFSATPRFVGKADLHLDASALKAAGQACAGWDPRAWSVDQTARTLLVLSYPIADADAYVQTLELLYETADVAEAVALYQMLPLLPYRKHFLNRATEGLRTNITTVFNAVALRNPYPATYFVDNAFNQMVLKAVFIDSPLHQIVGLDRRTNAKLARMLSDYAHERWAASRSVTPELWRPVGPFATDALLPDLERVFRDTDPILQQAGALALAASPAEGAQHLLAEHPKLKAAIDDHTLTWDTFATAVLS